MIKRVSQVHLLYVILAIAAATSVWAFLQAERHHKQTYRVLQETYEIQWRGTQIRERLTGVMAKLEIALATGKPPPRIVRDVRHLAHNIRQTLALEYIGHYLKEPDIGLLRNALEIIQTKVTTAVEGESNFSDALAHLNALREDMFRVSIAAGEHMTAYDASARNGDRILRYSFLLAMAFGTILLISGSVVWQSRFVRWKEQHLRSFSNLFAHTTTSHIVALRLFLDEIKGGEIPETNTIDQARSVARDLEQMNVRLRGIIMAYEQRKQTLTNQLRPLSALLDGIAGNIEPKKIIKLELTDEALDARVPASQFHLILDELVRNAGAALEGRGSPRIVIRGRIHRPLLGPRRLVIDVTDNGSGMTENVRKHATMPFFSTRGGNHTGMGLSSIADLIRSMKGKLRLDSVAGRGTSVQFDFPIGRL